MDSLGDSRQMLLRESSSPGENKKKKKKNAHGFAREKPHACWMIQMRITRTKTRALPHLCKILDTCPTRVSRSMSATSATRVPSVSSPVPSLSPFGIIIINSDHHVRHHRLPRAKTRPCLPLPCSSSFSTATVFWPAPCRLRHLYNCVRFFQAWLRCI